MAIPDRDYAQLTANARLMAMTICGQVRDYRLAANWSQATLGTKVGTTQSAISEWENGIVMPQLHQLMVLCMVLGIPFSFGGRSQT